MNVKIIGLSEAAFRRITEYCSRRCFKSYEASDGAYDCTLDPCAIVKINQKVWIDFNGYKVDIESTDFVKLEVI